MPLERFIETYGYFALLIGVLLEGETIVLLAGFAAHQGYMSLPLVVIIAFLGTLFGDQLFFSIGRYRGKAFLDRRPRWRPKVDRVSRLLERYHNLVILGFRFIYGMRAVTPFVIGVSKIKTLRFALLNFVSALAWAAIIAFGGFLFGRTLESGLASLRHYELGAVAGVAFIAMAVWTIRSLRKRAGKRNSITQCPAA